MSWSYIVLLLLILFAIVCTNDTLVSRVTRLQCCTCVVEQMSQGSWKIAIINYTPTCPGTDEKLHLLLTVFLNGIPVHPVLPCLPKLNEDVAVPWNSPEYVWGQRALHQEVDGWRVEKMTQNKYLFNFCC